MLIVLAVALARESQLRRSAARIAVLAERRRVDRDLHDGIAQDLAFIASYSSTLNADGSGEHPLGLAPRRALAVSRGVIAELSDLDDRPVTEGLAVVASELAERFRISVRIDAPENLNLPQTTRHDLLRIVREAIANAARHGSAKHVTVTVRKSAEAAWCCECGGDGHGLITRDGRKAVEGFGLGSMRERAAALGGRLTLVQPADGGTELVVAVP